MKIGRIPVYIKLYVQYSGGGGGVSYSFRKGAHETKSKRDSVRMRVL